ncbi:MAG TPA: hypothetical protein VGJ36_08050 [Gemmatimonadales bacterium]|jgi:hypothetical protein
MPFKSRAQRRKFAELLVKGEISPETFEEWNRATGGAKLPEHIRKASPGRKKRVKSKTGTKTRRKSTAKSKRKTVHRSK